VTTLIDTHRLLESPGGGAGPARDVKQPARASTRSITRTRWPSSPSLTWPSRHTWAAPPWSAISFARGRGSHNWIFCASGGTW